MKKRLLAILLSLMMVLSLLPVGVFAEETESTKVAKVGETEYATLAEAVKDATAGATITLLDDVALDSTLTLDKNLILDLNGHVISNGDKLKTNYLVKVTYGAEVSIIGNKENSSINDTRTNPTGTITAICVFGNLTVDGAELTISRGLNGIAIKVDESGADKLGKLTVKSGKVSSTQAIQNWGITTIDGGTFTGDVGSHAYSNIGGDLTINEGIFNGPVYSAQLKYGTWPTAQAKTTIVNGTFNDVVAEYYDDGTNGLQPVERSDKPDGDVNCKVAISGGTFSNLSCVKYMTADSKVIVDLNGKTVSGGADFYAGDLTIKNGTVEGTVWVNASTTDAKYNHLTVAADATIGKGDYAVVLYQAMVGANNFGSTIDVYGKLNGMLWVQGNIKTDLKSATNPCVINVHDGAEIEDKTDATNVGIALNGAAILNVGKATIAGSTGIEVRAGQMTLNGATVIGKATPMTVKPNGNGTTTDGAGIAVAQHTTKLPIEVTINSGAISGYTAFYESNPQNNAAEDLAKINIAVKGGEFKTINGGTVAVYSADKTGFITGGTFTSDPSAYCATGKTGIVSGNVYTVGDIATNVEVAPAAPAASAATDGKTKEVATAMKSAATAIGSDKTTVEGLTAVGGTEASKVTTDDVTKAAEDLKAAGVTPSEGQPVTVYVQPYLDIKVTDAKIDSSKTTELTMEINPMIKKVASTATNAKDINLPTDEGTTNAKVLSTEKVTVTTPVTITIPLPTGLGSDTTKPIYIKHVKENGATFVYEATVTQDGETYYAKFTNPNGFSTFTVTATNPAVAKIGSVGYTTLQAAVDAAKDNDTIKLEQNVAADTKATVAKTVKFTVDTNSKTFDKDKNIVVGNYTTVKVTGTASPFTYEFTYTAPSYSAPITKKDVKFDDVDVNAYYAPAVKWAVENKITAGKTDKLFAPDDTCTRGEMITFLWNAAGKPAAKNTTNPFTDVNVGAFYYDAVLWAVSNGITSGTTDTTFSPDNTVSRAQVVAFLYNYANKPAAANSTFTDVAADAYYAPAIGWAAAQKITSGTGNNTFSPENDCTRAQIVTFLYNDLAK